MSRNSASTMVHVLVGAAVAIIVAACGPATSPASLPPSVSPALPSAATSFPAESQSVAPASPVALRLCRPGEVVIGSVWWTGATAEMAGGFTLLDIGPSPCQVGGRPTAFSMLDQSGRPLALHVESFEPGQGDGGLVLLVPTGPASTDPLHPGPTGVQVFWTNWCGDWAREGTLVVSLPQIGELRAPISNLSAPRCESPGQPSVVQLSFVITPP